MTDMTRDELAAEWEKRKQERAHLAQQQGTAEYFERVARSGMGTSKLGGAFGTIERNARRMYEEQKARNEPIDKPFAPRPVCPVCGDGHKCHACGDAYEVMYQFPDGRREARACPDCWDTFIAAKRERLRVDINRMWPLEEWELLVARSTWKERPNAPAALTARRYQLEIMAEMPSSTTFLLYGVPGVGKTRLLLEIAAVAREQGLSSIYRTAEKIRGYLQYDFKEPDQEVRTRLRRRSELAWSHLGECDVLCLDEIDDARGEAFPQQILELINHRIAAGLTTCAAGNAVLSQLPAPITSRLRAKNMLHVDMTGDEDARPYFGHGPQRVSDAIR